MPRPRKSPQASSSKRASEDEEEGKSAAATVDTPVSSPALKRQRTTYNSPDDSPAGKMEKSPGRITTRSSSSSSQASAKITGTTPTSKKKPLQKQGKRIEEEDEEEGGEKRQRSLEALFKVTDSELASMSKDSPRKTPDSRKVTLSSSASPAAKAVQESPQTTESPQANQVIEIHIGSESIATTATQVLARSDPTTGQITFSIPCLVQKQKQVALQQHLVRARSEEPSGQQYATSSQSFEEEHQRMLAKKAVSVDVVSPAVVQSVEYIRSPGRKPKLPIRPGKYPCPFCNRTCAKPSVLEKHIRAHTNERPYPCETCRIAFKTKSNLFKHKKSRSHLLRAGLATPEQLKSSSKESLEEEVIETDEADTDGNETDTSIETCHQDSFTSQESLTESMEKNTINLSEYAVVKSPSGELRLVLPEHTTRNESQGMDTPRISHEVDLRAKRERLKKGKGTSLPNLPLQPRSPSPLQRVQSIGGPKLTVSELANLPEELKTERINAHINQLISANNDIVSAPKAAPPRPKRGPRLMKPSESASAVQGLMSSSSIESFDSPSTPYTRMGMPRLYHGSSSSSGSLDTPIDISQLGTGDQIGTPTIHSSVSRTLPQEIKIQIKLGPPGTSGGGLITTPSMNTSGGGLITNPLGGLVSTPVTETGKLGSFTPIISSLGQVLGTTVSAPIYSNTPIGTSPLIGQPAVQLAETPTSSSALKELMTKGNRTPPGNPVVIIESLKSSEGEKMTPEGQILDLPVLSTSKNISYQQYSLDMPHAVAEQGNRTPPGNPMVIIESPEGEKMTPEGQILDLPVLSTSKNISYQQYSLDMPHTVAEQVEVVSTETRTSSGRPGVTRSYSVPSTSSQPTTPATPNTPYNYLIFDQYDPHSPPKRGRPKGSRNVMRERSPVLLAPNTPTTPVTNPGYIMGQFSVLPQAPVVTNTSSRPTLKLMIPSQSNSPLAQSPVVLNTPTLLVSSTNTPGISSQLSSLALTPTSAPSKLFGVQGTPAGTPGTPNTPTAHLKKILKGQILMKRSISMSSGLYDPKDGNKPGSSSSPQKYLRSESVDEAALRHEQETSMATSVIAQMLNSKPQSKPMVRRAKSDAGVTQSGTLHEDETSQDKVVNDELQIDICKENKEPKEIRIPVNTNYELFHPLGYHTSPLLLSTRPFPKQLAIIPKILSGKAKLEAWDSKERDGSVDTTDSQNESTDSQHEASKPDDKMEDVEKMDTEIKAMKQSSTESGIDMSSSGLASPELPEDKAALEHKAKMQMLLLSHQYPVLQNHTHTTFCTVVKPQPAYVAMEGVQISMYSNWRAATYNPNPHGLTSRQLMDLYHSRWYDVAPSLYASSPICDTKAGTLTHSSYWNYYKAEAHESLEKIDALSQAETIRNLLKLDQELLSPEIQEERLQLSPPAAAAPVQQVIFVDSATLETVNVEMESTPVTTPPQPDKRGQLGFAGGSKSNEEYVYIRGGYKSNEEYVYIRGKGRGKYVCEQCGIRCKKPSMLKKHIRTHTDFRPYICSYCSLRFKTKGNLSKHMKSKAHHKKCVQLGLDPVPTAVEDSQIDADVLTKQSFFAKNTRIIDVSNESNESSFADDDDEDADDDDNDDEIDDGVTMVIEDGTIIQVESTKEIETEGEMGEPQYLAVQGDSNDVKLVHIDSQAEEVPIDTVEVFTTTKHYLQGEVRPSMDKELAAHTLLDLSKQTDPQQDDSGSDTQMEGQAEKRRKLPRQQCISDDDAASDKGDQRLDSLIGALKTRTKQDDKPVAITETGHALLTKVGHSAAASSARMATTVYQSPTSVKFTASSPPAKTTPTLIRSDSESDTPGRKVGTTYAQKIAALQNKTLLDLKLKIGKGGNKAGFVPPVFEVEVKERLKAAEKHEVDEKVEKTSERHERPRLVKSGSEPVARPPQKTLGVPNPKVLMRQKSVDIDSRGMDYEDTQPFTLTLPEEKSGKSHEQSTAHRRKSLSRQASVAEDDSYHPEHSATEYNKQEGQDSSTVFTIEIPSGDGVQKIRVPMPLFQSKQPSAQVHYVTEGNHAPHEIHPIPGKVTDRHTGGRYVCTECDKVLPSQTLLTMHLNVHMLESQHKCEDCNQSFQSKTLLQKHRTTNEHRARAALNKQVASAQGDTSRIFRCNDCDIAFFTHTNLAKHFRSHKHIMTLEKIGKLPIGAALKLEKLDLKYMDSQDSEVALQNLLHLYDPVSYKKPSKKSEEDYHYQGYERVASNEKVTVEMKTSTIDLGDISRRRGDTHDEDSGDGQSSSSLASKCGICGQNFSSPDSLQRHMASHAELRPYVCQHCDAGFTRYSNLEAHLSNCKQSQQSYMCGQCKGTYSSIASLQQHHCVFSMATTIHTATATSSSAQVVQMVPVSADGKVLYLPLLKRTSKPLQLVRSRSIASAPTPEATPRNPGLLRSASDAGAFSEVSLMHTVVQSPSIQSPSPLVQIPLLQSQMSVSGMSQSPLIRPSSMANSPLIMLPQTPVSQPTRAPFPQSHRAQSTLAHTNLAHSPLAQSPLAHTTVAHTTLAHSPLVISPLAHSPLTRRAPLPVSPLAKGTKTTISPKAQATRTLFKDDSKSDSPSKNDSKINLVKTQLSSDTNSQKIPLTIKGQNEGEASTSSFEDRYKAADEATKQHLAKLLNTDQASLGQVQVMELGAESIQQMGLATEMATEDGEVLFVIQMNEGEVEELQNDQRAAHQPIHEEHLTDDVITAEIPLQHYLQSENDNKTADSSGADDTETPTDEGGNVSHSQQSSSDKSGKRKREDDDYGNGEPENKKRIEEV